MNVASVQSHHQMQLGLSLAKGREPNDILDTLLESMIERHGLHAHQVLHHLQSRAGKTDHYNQSNLVQSSRNTRFFLRKLPGFPPAKVLSNSSLSV